MITTFTSAAGAGTQVNTTSTTGKNGIMGKDDFMKLLVAQMQAQDPLDPMSNTEFSAQLAQFSALEQMQNVNGNLQQLIGFQAANNNNMAVNLIDKTVTVPGNNITIDGGNPDSVIYELGRNAALVNINIYDSSNNLAVSIDRNQETGGRHEFQWDGKDSDGRTLPDGDYSFQVSAVDGSGSPVATRTLHETLVTGILFDNGISYVVTEDGDTIDLKNITSVNSAL